MASITAPQHAPSTHYAPPTDATAAAPRRAWARAGLAAGVIGLVAFMSSGGMAVPEDALADNAELVRRLADKGIWVWLFQALMSAAALGLVVFGAGLKRRLDEQEPVGSLTGTVAFVGALLAAALSLVGGGISTELFWQLMAANDDLTSVDPDTVAANLAIYNTMGWVWAGVGLAAGAVAVAGLRHDSVGRKLAWFSAVMAGLVGLFQLIPLQYLAALPAALWLVVVGVAMSRSPKSA